MPNTTANQNINNSVMSSVMRRKLANNLMNYMTFLYTKIKKNSKNSNLELSKFAHINITFILYV